jgi:hypothetical protein
VLDEVAARAVAQAAALDATRLGLRVAVDGLSVDEAAAAVLNVTGWPKDR